MSGEHTAPSSTPRRRRVAPGTMAKARRIVFGRADWTCQDCGVRIPPKTTDEESGNKAPGIWGTGVCLELDHIVPVAAGGLFLINNLRALCSRCNARKGASTEFAGWPDRIARALQILESKPPTASSARAAVLALMGGDA